MRCNTHSLTVLAGGSINADTKGYRGGTKYTAGSSYGPGHGGFGGRKGRVYGLTYDSAQMPEQPGSGGGSHNGLGGRGGGMIRIECSSVLLVNGSIEADAVNGGDRAGGGSGGGIYIECDVVRGTNGVISAKGGNGLTTGRGGGGGGGGRIAIWRVNDKTGGAIVPTVDGGTGERGDGEVGTIVYVDIAPAGTVFLFR